MINKKLIAASLLFSVAAHSTDMAKAPKYEGDESEVIFGEALKVEVPSKTYNISNYHINRIVTPFKNPSMKMDAVEGTTYQQKANVIYLSTKSDRKIAAFITEKGQEDNAIKVTLEPRKIPAQEIVLGGAMSNNNLVARKFEKSLPRVDVIKKVLGGIAKGAIPLGYTQQKVNAMFFPKCDQDGLNFDFYNGQFFSGGDYVVSVGVVVNNTNTIIELKENNCFKEGVVAVAAFPITTLSVGEKSEIFVMFQREKQTAESTRSSRKSLIK